MVDMFSPFLLYDYKEAHKILKKNKKEVKLIEKNFTSYNQNFFHGYHKMSEETEQYSKDLGEINIYI